MDIGHLRDKANSKLVYFVFFCILLTTGLLYMLESVQETGSAISTQTKIGDLMD
ncbi:MAG: hypothetical protein WCK48_00255 [bacterium]